MSHTQLRPSVAARASAAGFAALQHKFQDNLEGAVGLIVTKQNTMSRTVTIGGEQYVTRRKGNYGKKRSSKVRLLRELKSNENQVYWQYKGLGKPWNYGFYNVQKFKFVDTDTYVALPLFVFDLTSTPNVIASAVNWVNPGMRCYWNQSQSRIEWKPLYHQGNNGSLMPNANYAKGDSQTFTGVPSSNQGWQVCGGQAANDSALSLYPYANDYIANIDVKLMLYAAKTTPCRYKIDICSLPEDLCPYNSNNGATYESICGDPDLHNTYWSNEISKWTQHPINQQRGIKTGGQRLAFWKSGGGWQNSYDHPRSQPGFPKIINFDPKDSSLANSSVASGRCHIETIQLRPNRTVNLSYKGAPLPRADEVGQTVQTNIDGVPDTISTLGNAYQVSPKPEERLYMFIYGTDWSDITTAKTSGAGGTTPVRGTGGASGNIFYGGKLNDVNDAGAPSTANVDFNNSGSFDLSIIKRCMRLN